jgi:hypothetical protein
MIVVSVIFLAGCSSNEKSIENDSTNQSEKNVEYIFDKTWYRYDDKDNERLAQLTFDSTKKSISYYYPAAGDPVDDFDLYEKYEFDENEKIIIALSNHEDYEDIEIKIIDVRENTIELSFENEIRKFYLSEDLAKN